MKFKLVEDYEDYSDADNYRPEDDAMDDSRFNQMIHTAVDTKSNFDYDHPYNSPKIKDPDFSQRKPHVTDWRYDNPISVAICQTFGDKIKHYYLGGEEYFVRADDPHTYVCYLAGSALDSCRENNYPGEECTIPHKSESQLIDFVRRSLNL